MTTVLITGGTGSLGQELVKQLIPEIDILKIIVFSRDEHKQEQMKAKSKSHKLRYFVGDIRDLDRLRLAFRNVAYVIHTAALKIVPSGEYNPTEYINTNILGTQNVIRAAYECAVPVVTAISTDKAVRPVNLYGATKLCMEKLMLAANNMLPFTSYNIVRYGNVANANGSVIPVFKHHYELGKPLPVTHHQMTRYWIELEEAARFVIDKMGVSEQGKIFIPDMPSFKVTSLAQAFGSVGNWPVLKYIGIREGEKLHEQIDEDRSSDRNDIWLDVDQLRRKLIAMGVVKP